MYNLIQYLLMVMEGNEQDKNGFLGHADGSVKWEFISIWVKLNCSDSPPVVLKHCFAEEEKYDCSQGRDLRR